MDYKTFKAEIVKKLTDMVDSDVSIKCHNVLKNNSVQYEALSLIKSGINASPNFYLQKLYDNYLEKKNVYIDEICDEIIKVFNNNIANPKYGKLAVEFEDVKDKVVMRLISKEENKALLSECPSKDYLDMSIVFYILVDFNEDNVASIRISNLIAEKWGINAEGLYEIAIDNTLRLLDAKVVRLKDMIFSTLNQADNKIISDEEKDLIYENPSNDKIYVLTNKTGINGACVFIFDKVIDKLKTLLRGDFFILPSSIHEVIAMKREDEDESNKLIDVVREINESVVDKEDFLSDNIYLYDSLKGNYTVVSNP